MTAATGLKRILIAGAAAAAAVVIALVTVPFAIPASAVRDAVAREIHTVTGLDPALSGDVAVSLFPSGRVTFRNVVLSGDRSGDPGLVAEELTAHLRYFPLLSGHIEISDVTLVRPTITVTVQPDGGSNWSGLIQSLARALEPDPNRTASFSEIGIHEGVVIVRSNYAGSAVTDRLDEVDFQLAWPSISRSFGAKGRFVWHDQPVEASFALSDFLAALNGDSSGVKMRLSSAPAKLTFDGTASDRSSLKLDGTLSAESPSLREALRWADARQLPFGGFGKFALRAESSMADGIVSMSGVNVELDGNVAEGAITLSTDRHTVQGTLAADALDLTPYVSGIHLLAENDRNWDQLPLGVDSLDDFNLDLRLSAANVKINTAQLGRTAVAANMRNGKLDVTIGESQAFGGVAKGSFGLARDGSGITVTSHVQFAEVDLENCLSQVFGIRKLEGHGNLALNVEGSGSSVLAVTSTLAGTASLTAHDGALAGINVEQLLRRLERRPLSGNGDFRTGRTPFDKLALNLKIDQGQVSVDDMHIEGPTVRVAVAGQVSVPTRDLDLKGVATLMSSASASEFDLPFVVQGQWDDPIMLPDAQSLIRRSGAAAPLLEAIKAHNAGAAVRSVIDKLMAAPAVTNTPAPAR